MEGLSAELYDKAWESQWDDMKIYGPFSCHLRRIIKKMIRPLDFHSVLDVGCGQGSFLQELQLEFPSINPLGIDISSSAVALARERVPAGNFYVLDITNKSLDEKCDLVVCSEVLEHITDDISALRNLRKMTRRYLLVSTPQGRMREFEKHDGEMGSLAFAFTAGISVAAYLLCIYLWRGGFDALETIFDLKFSLTLLTTVLISYHLYPHDLLPVALSLILLFRYLNIERTSRKSLSLAFYSVLLILFLPVIPRFLISSSALGWGALPLLLLFTLLAADILYHEQAKRVKHTSNQQIQF